MAGDTFLTIGEVARLTGLTVKTIRFWPDEGLVPPADRTPAGYRLYDSGSLAPSAAASSTISSTTPSPGWTWAPTSCP